MKRMKFSKLIAVTVIMITAFSLMTPNISALTANGVPLPDLKEEIDPDISTDLKLNYFVKHLVIPAILDVSSKNANLDGLNTDKVTFDETKQAFYLKRPADATAKGFTVEKLGTLVFENAGKIGNRPINIDVSIDEVACGAIGESNFNKDQTEVLFALFHNGEFWLCGNTDINSVGFGHNWNGHQTATITTTVRYADGAKEQVDLNFIQCISDLDMANDEGSETVSGYTGKYYYYADSTWAVSTTNDGQLSFVCKEGNGNLGGLDSFTKGGVYLQTENGKFTTKVNTTNSGTAYMLFCQYLNKSENPNPYKKITSTPTSESESYATGDTVTFDISFTMFNMFDNFERYSDLSIYDELPAGLDFDSAVLIDSEGAPIESAGTLTQPSVDNKNTVTFTFNKGWLNTDSNYNGKDVVLHIVTKVNNGAESGTISNVGWACINNKEHIKTNEVTFNVTKVAQATNETVTSATEPPVPPSGGDTPNTPPKTTTTTTTAEKVTTVSEEETIATPETTVTVPETTAIVSSEETTATTKAEENPVTGNAPVAMLSVAAALAAAMLLIKKKSR